MENDLQSSITYTLLHDGVTTPLQLPFTSFQPLTLAEAGVYQCSMEIASPYIDGVITMTTEEHTIAFQCE